MIVRIIILNLVLLFHAVCIFGYDEAGFQTELQKSGYSRITKSAEISCLLDKLTQCYQPLARKEVIGKSAGGQPIEAIVIGKKAENQEAANRLTVMVISGQHGTEPSGPEALMIIARELLQGDLRPLSEHMEVILVPNTNPDGRENHRRVNNNGVNLSTDYVSLTQPETQVLNSAIIRWQPEVLLDVHESAILKKKSLGSEGYLTDFEAQFEVANNPNAPKDIRTMSLEQLLPQILSQINAKRLPAQRYIGEITSTTQPVTNGGLSIRNVRNKAGLYGVFAFLVENHLDPSDKDYPTFRNIKVRVEKQILCIKTFLNVMHSNRDAIVSVSQKARTSKKTGQTVELNWEYVQDKTHPKVTLPLMKRDTGQVAQITFADHRIVKTWNTLTLPSTYVVTKHMELIKPVLDRNNIAYKVIDQPIKARVQAMQPAAQGQQKPVEAETTNSDHRNIDLEVKPGALWIELDQLSGPLVPLLLEVNASSSIFLTSPCSILVEPKQDFFIYRL